MIIRIDYLTCAFEKDTILSDKLEKEFIDMNNFYLERCNYEFSDRYCTGASNEPDIEFKCFDSLEEKNNFILRYKKWLNDVREELNPTEELEDEILPCLEENRYCNYSEGHFYISDDNEIFFKYDDEAFSKKYQNKNCKVLHPQRVCEDDFKFILDNGKLPENYVDNLLTKFWTNALYSITDDEFINFLRKVNETKDFASINAIMWCSSYYAVFENDDFATVMYNEIRDHKDPKEYQKFVNLVLNNADEKLALKTEGKYVGNMRVSRVNELKYNAEKQKPTIEEVDEYNALIDELINENNYWGLYYKAEDCLYGSDFNLQNYKEAEKCLLKLYDLKQYEYAKLLGDIYLEGLNGEAPNYKKAYEYYSVARDAGYVNAELKIANMYRDGLYVSKDIDVATNMYKRLYEKLKKRYFSHDLYNRQYEEDENTFALTLFNLSKLSSDVNDAFFYIRFAKCISLEVIKSYCGMQFLDTYKEIVKLYKEIFNKWEYANRKCQKIVDFDHLTINSSFVYVRTHLINGKLVLRIYSGRDDLLAGIKGFKELKKVMLVKVVLSIKNNYINLKFPKIFMAEKIEVNNHAIYFNDIKKIPFDKIKISTIEQFRMSTKGYFPEKIFALE